MARGSSVDALVNVEASGLLDTLRTFRYRLPDIGDGIADEIGRDAREHLQMELVRNGSDVTGAGKRSIDSIKTSRGERKVVGNYYLWVVDQGGPPRYVDTDSKRLQVWAREHGFTVDEIAQIIAEKGTRAHPFIDQAFRRTRKTARKNAVKVLKRRL